MSTVLAIILGYVALMVVMMAFFEFQQWNFLRKMAKRPPIHKDVSRVEVIDDAGRSYTNWGVESVQLSLQDDRKTLKIFINAEEIK